MTAPTTPYTHERVDADIAAAQRRLAEARAFRTEVDGLRGRATSRDRAVTVSVDATGLVLDVEFSDPLPSARDLRRTLLETVHEAQQQVAARAVEAAADAFGATAPVTTHLRDELASRFVTTDPAGARTGSDLGRGARFLQ